MFVATIWSIWKARNDFCFQHIPFSSHGVIRLFASDMKIKLDHLQGVHLDPLNGRWNHPPPGYYKLNIDNEGQWVWGYIGFCGSPPPYM